MTLVSQPFSWVSRHQNVSIVDFTVAKDGGGGGNNWSYKTCKAPVKLSPTTHQHPNIFTGRMPFLSTNQQRQSWKHRRYNAWLYVQRWVTNHTICKFRVHVQVKVWFGDSHVFTQLRYYCAHNNNYGIGEILIRNLNNRVWPGVLLMWTISEMTYTVSSGTLNPSIPYHTNMEKTKRAQCASLWNKEFSFSGRLHPSWNINLVVPGLWVRFTFGWQSHFRNQQAILNEWNKENKKIQGGTRPQTNWCH